MVINNNTNGKGCKEQLLTSNIISQNNIIIMNNRFANLKCLQLQVFL